MHRNLRQAIEEFKAHEVPNAYAGDEGEPDTYTVEQIASDGNLAEGYCADVSEAFVAFLAERGLEARVVDGVGTDFGYTGWGANGPHYVVMCDGLMIDWTHLQFGGNGKRPTLGEPLLRKGQS